MGGIVLGIIGKIRSGKTSLSQGLSENLRCPQVSFGDQVREVAKARDLELLREVLQEIGEDLIENSAKEFCEAVLAQAKWQPGQSLVVDGIRHLEIVKILRDLVDPAVLRLVYVETPDGVREIRLITEIDDTEELDLIEHHSTEIQVSTILRKQADLIVDGTKPLSDLIDEIGSWLDRERVK